MWSRLAALVSVTSICVFAGGVALGATAASPGTSATAAAATTTGTTPTTTGTTTTGTTTTSSAPALEVCVAAEARTLATVLGVRAAAIHERQFVSTNGMPQCNYLIARAHRAGPHDKVVVTVNVDNGPQPHWRLMRKVVEAGQLFGPIPPGWRPPVGVQGLGAYASWFPNLEQLMALNIGHQYLLTVGAIWRHATKSELRSLSFKAILVYRRIKALPAV